MHLSSNLHPFIQKIYSLSKYDAPGIMPGSEGTAVARRVRNLFIGQRVISEKTAQKGWYCYTHSNDKKLKAQRSKVTSPKSFELEMAQPGSKLNCLTNKPMPLSPPSHLP